MKQKLLTDIELDVHELKYLMDSFTKEPTPTLSELLKRSITRMQGRLDELQQEVDAVQVISPSAVEETAEEEDEVAGSEEDSPVIIQSLESVVVKEDEEGEAIVAEEKPVVIAADAETAAEACGTSNAETEIAVIPEGMVRYTVPTRICANRTPVTKIKFRVGRPVETAKIRITSGDKVIFESKKAKKFVPSIMENVNLTAAQLADVQDEIKVTLV